MSFQYPKRVKDLPTLELDSDEDEFKTPQKPSKAELQASTNDTTSNKENEVDFTNTSTSSRNAASFNNFRMYPKRSNELPTLESDSEEEDYQKDDHLNCAILNDSFIMSPYKSEQDESSSSIICSARKSKSKPCVNDSMSFISSFDKMGITSGKKIPMQTELDLSIAPTKSMPLRTIEEHQVTKHFDQQPPLIEVEDQQMHNSEFQAKRKDVETPYKTASSIANLATITTSTATKSGRTSPTLASSENQFATPQIRSFSIKRQPQNLCSANSKTSSAIVNEFRSQKVLFQTPMTAMSRAPVSRLLPNDSITLSLCDTINEIGSTGNTPNTTEKCAQKPAEVAETNRHLSKVESQSKKSLEDAFNETLSTRNEKVSEKVSPKAPVATTVMRTNSLTGTETVLHINDSDYAIMKKLGCGGSSSVYLAQRTDNGKECALKVVDLQGDPAVVEGYLNETKLLAKLQGNVCVVSLYEYQLLQKESKLYVVMEKGDSDLHKILQSYTNSLPLYVLTNFVYQMLQAVNYIHQNGVIHSDLKPANFLMVNGRLKLIDFGIASNIAIDSTSIIKFSQAGTFNYISPEALIDTSTGSSPARLNQPKIKISTKSDVWSLGCILYLLLFKKTPFSHIKNIYAKISAISNPMHIIEYPAIPPYYPVILVQIVKLCLQHNPKKRPSCADLLQLPFHMMIPIQNLAIPNSTQTSSAATEQKNI